MEITNIIFISLVIILFIFVLILLTINDLKEKSYRRKIEEYNKEHEKEYALYLDADNRLDYLLSYFSSLYKNPVFCKNYEEYQSKMKELETQIEEQRQIMDKYEQKRKKEISKK